MRVDRWARGGRPGRRELVVSAALAAALLAALLPGGAAEATSTSGGSLPTVPSGPRPGPDLLYAPATDAPQLQNTGIWHAAPILVSGSSAYRAGEFVYQDYLYDDHGLRDTPDPTDRLRSESALSQPDGTLTYPTAAAYAGNLADLVEVRVKPLADATAFRLTLNTVTDPALVAATLAIGTSALPRPLPHAANVAAPAGLFLTWHGTVAEVLDATTGRPLPQPATASVDMARRQIELRLPHADWDPGRSPVRLAAAVGLWDPAAGTYLQPQAVADAGHPGGAATPGPHAALFNVGFRFAEPVHPGDTKVTDPAMWRDNAQATALSAGDISPFSATVDFARLADHVDDDMPGQPAGVPVSGPMNRILASSRETASGVHPETICSAALVEAGSCAGQFTGRLQPYSVYVPPLAAPTRGYGLTLLLHSFTENYNEFTGLRYQSELGNIGTGSVVLTPEARGPDGFYYSGAEADVFETWADVARHYRLDGGRAAIAGYSMGAVGVWRIASQFPDLFARAAPAVSGPNNTEIPNLRNVPLLVWLAGQDELQTQTVFVATQLQLDSIGYPYEVDYFEPADHLTLHLNDEWAPVAAFLADNVVDRSPPHVSLTYNPSVDFPDLGIVGDHAYWVSSMRPRSASGGVSTPYQGSSTTASIDVRSGGFGISDPGFSTWSGAGTLGGGQLPALPYVSHGVSVGSPPPTPVVDRLTITATNVAEVTIDPVRARVTCAAALAVTTDGPMIVHLSGCPGGGHVVAPPAAAGASGPTLPNTGSPPLLPQAPDGAVLLAWWLLRGHRRRTVTGGRPIADRCGRHSPDPSPSAA